MTPTQTAQPKRTKGPQKLENIPPSAFTNDAFICKLRKIVIDDIRLGQCRLGRVCIPRSTVAMIPIGCLCPRDATKPYHVICMQISRTSTEYPWAYRNLRMPRVECAFPLRMWKYLDLSECRQDEIIYNYTGWITCLEKVVDKWTLNPLR